MVGFGSFFENFEKNFENFFESLNKGEFFDFQLRSLQPMGIHVNQSKKMVALCFQTIFEEYVSSVYQNPNRGDLSY